MSIGIMTEGKLTELKYGFETAFIDDRDDMEFYNNHKNAMAQAVAGAIRDYFAS